MDILAREKRSGIVVLLEVRGRGTSRFLPRQMISPGKRRRLLRIARSLQSRYREVVRIELVEIVGELPRGRVGGFFCRWFVRWFPEAWGMRIDAFAVE